MCRYNCQNKCGVPKGTISPMKGKKRNITWGKQLSIALKGRKIIWAKKIGLANKGKKLTNETKRKLSISCMGRVAWNKGLRKVSYPDKIFYGKQKSEHWNWKGGISKENILLRQSSEYKLWRDKVFKRDNWTCKICNNRGDYLEADHVKSFAQYPDLRFDINNGRTLCKECHKELHFSRN